LCEQALAAPSSVSVENLAVLGPGAGGHHGHFLGGLQAAAYVVMTLLVIVWALFSAPTWCGAVNRQRGGEVEYCRNNSSGLLLGCWIRHHKFQHFTSAWWITNWRDRMRGIWAGAPAKLATISAGFGIITGTIGVMVDLPTLASRL
jgi:hypothetical protein